jgi:butyryl-CoA dehydrogenase
LHRHHGASQRRPPLDRPPTAAEYAEALARAVDAVQSATHAAWAGGNPRDALANATPYLQAFGHTALAWMWLDVAIAATRGLDSPGAPGADFYRGKLQAARYFFRYELPKIGAWLDVVARRDSTCRDMADAWF